MSLRLRETAPNFTASTAEGEFRFHESLRTRRRIFFFRPQESFGDTRPSSIRVLDPRTASQRSKKRP